MKKTTKIAIIVIIAIVILTLGIFAIVYFSLNNVANMEEYKIGEDSIRSINTVVGKRYVNKISSNTKSGVSTKQIEYKSDTVNQDLVEYVDDLISNQNMKLNKDMDLTLDSSEVELSRNSIDDSKIIIMTIKYDQKGYDIIIKKMDKNKI